MCSVKLYSIYGYRIRITVKLITQSVNLAEMIYKTSLPITLSAFIATGLQEKY